MKKIRLLLVLFLSVVALASCGGDDTEEKTPVEEVPTETIPVAATVTEISVVDGYKTSYYVGDNLDLSTLKINVSYSDGSESLIDVTSEMVSSYNLNSVGPKTITITYEGKTTTISVVVNPVQVEVVLSSIAIKGSYVTEYKVGDTLDLTDMILVLTYSDATTEQIPVTMDMLGNYDMSEAGPKRISVTYEGKSTSFDILVEAEEIVKMDPVVEISIETGDKLVIGVDADPVVTVTPGDLEYTVHYSADEVVMGTKFSDLTTAGTYAFVVEVIGNEYYNDYKTWVVFKVVENKLEATIDISIENGATLYIGVDGAPTVNVTPSDLEYEVYYTKDDGATNLGSEFPTTPGTYAINVKVSETDTYNKTSAFRWFVLKEVATEPVVKVDPVFDEVNGALKLVGFVDENGDNVSIDSSLYTYHYSFNEQEIGTDVPTVAGTYAIVIEFTNEANYEFITLNISTLSSKIWKVFTIKEESSDVIKIDVVFNEVDGGVVFGGFVDANGISVELDPSLYDVHYEANEVNIGSQLPTEVGDYAIVVSLVESANYEFITLNIPSVTKKVWRGFKVSEITDQPDEGDVIMIDAVISVVDGGLVFDGFIDENGLDIVLDPSLYNVHYEANEVNVGTVLPTEPGSYAIVIELVESANYEFITKNIPSVTKKVWQGFTISEEDNSVKKIDPVIEEVEGGLVFKGFIDENGTPVTLESSLYEVHYEANEVNIGSQLPTASGTYVIVVKLTDSANYEFITLNNVNLPKKIWRVFTVVNESVTSVTIKTHVDDEGVIIFDGFIDESGNDVEIESTQYRVYYEKSEKEISRENFESGVRYTLVVIFEDGAPYQFINKDGFSYSSSFNKLWVKFYFTPVA